MRLRTTIVMTVLALLGLAYIFFVENMTDSARREKDELARIISFQPEKVRAFEIEVGDNLIRCADVDGEWHVVQPIKAKADRSAVNRLLASLSKLKSDAVITRSERFERGLTVVEYGLAPPFAIIRIEGDGFRRLLNLGSRSTDGNSLYIACDNAKENIYSVDSSFLESVPSEVSRLRSKMIFAYDPGEVSRVDIKTAEGFISISANDAGSWNMQQPIAARADGAKVGKLVESICALKIARFLPQSDPDAAIYGFDEVNSTVALRGDGDVLGVELRFGLPIKDEEGMIYAHVKGDDAVFAAPGQILDALKQVGYNDLRSLDLLDMELDAINAVKIEAPQSAIELIRENGEWKVASPRNWIGDRARIESMLSQLLKAKVDEFRPLQSEDVWNGFDTNAVFLALSDSPPAKSDDAVRSDDEYYRVRMELRRGLDESSLSAVHADGRAWVALVPGGLFQSIATDPFYYRARTVLALDPDKVQSVRLKSSQGEQILEKSEDGNWRAGAIEPGQVTEVLPQQKRFDLFRKLECVEYVASGDYSPADYGLDPPKETLTVILSGEGGISKSILFGDELPDGSVYASIRGQDSVFRLAGDAAEILREDLYRIREDSAQ